MNSFNSTNHSSDTAAGITPVGFWSIPLEIHKNRFQHKSLSDFAANTAVGCGHACRFCYVPEVSTNKMGNPLAKLGVGDPDDQWGSYVFVRPFDEKKFRASVRRAEAMTADQLTADGHRAVMFCSTTDPYQVIFHPDPTKRKELNASHQSMVRSALKIIRDESTLNVRILTRSPLVRLDFDLLKSFGNRLVLGISLPTLRADLAKIYEPGAPAPQRRLETLRQASQAGIPVYVAMAPTFPESDYADLLPTLQAVKECNPVTVFHEPINIRAKNVERIAAHARELGVGFRSEVFDTNESWENYALTAFSDMERATRSTGLYDRLHLWVDGQLGTVKAVRSQPPGYTAWVNYWWHRISEWPGAEPRPANSLVAPANPFLAEAGKEAA